MFLEQWIHRVEGKVFSLGRGLWSTTPPNHLQQQIDTLQEERAANETTRIQLEQQADQLRAQISTWKEKIDHLVRQVSERVRAGCEAGAWPLVLELEDLRRQFAEANPRLPKLDQAAWSLQFRNRQIDRQLEELQLELERQQKPAPRPRRRPRQ